MGECHFRTRADKIKAVEQFLREFGDDLPDVAITHAIENLLDNFVLECDDKGKVISGVTYQPNTDWYLCTVKYLATDPKHQGQGLGSKVTKEVLKKTHADDRCSVLTADITFDNNPSKRIFHKYGFEDSADFCWGKGQKPATVLHMVKYPPKVGEDGKKTCDDFPF